VKRGSYFANLIVLSLIQKVSGLGFYLILLFLGLTETIYSQDSVTKKNPLTVSGYVEAYFSYDLANPTNHERAYMYNHKRHNEVNINLAYVKLNYATNFVRSNITLMGGNYPQYNLAAEPGLLRNLYEANVGIKISKNHHLWVDAGVFASHIGFESAVGKDCWNLSRSLLADNSPYYEAGVKLGYTSKNEQVYLAVMYLNGWQRIQRVNGNMTPDFGTQLTYKTKSHFSFNWSTFIGNDQPDSLIKWRYFNNFYTQFDLSKKVGIIAGFDVGLEQKLKHSSEYNTWYSPVLIVRYLPTSKLRLSARAEYYSDEKQIIVYTGTGNGYQTQGYSLNVDYLPIENVMFRLEARTFKSKDDVFQLNNKASNMNYFFTTALAIAF
jgi:hypothetical protein